VPAQDGRAAVRGEDQRGQRQQAFDLRYGRRARYATSRWRIFPSQRGERRLRRGNFAAVAKALSRDPQTAALGGQWPPLPAIDAGQRRIRSRRLVEVGEVSTCSIPKWRSTFIKVEQRTRRRWRAMTRPRHTSQRADGELVQDTMRRCEISWRARLQPNLLDIRDRTAPPVHRGLAEHKVTAGRRGHARRAAGHQAHVPATRSKPHHPAGRCSAAPSLCPPEAPQRPPVRVPVAKRSSPALVVRRTHPLLNVARDAKRQSAELLSYGRGRARFRCHPEAHVKDLAVHVKSQILSEYLRMTFGARMPNYPIETAA